MIVYLLIALGGALGSVTRYWLSNLGDSPTGSAFPWGTFWVNVTGCIVIGFVATLTAPGSRYFSHETRLFFMTGLCGGFTTFSAFSLQTLHLLREGDGLRAGAYVLSSVVVCLFSVWLGHLLAGPFHATS